uniref:False ORF n=1 Tax=Vibrio nigripulchritudo TaxID=28173 RepID=A0A9P1JLF9_9VIBR|nr:False ORF [Vibrio nigripulchritudo]
MQTLSAVACDNLLQTASLCLFSVPVLNWEGLERCIEPNASGFQYKRLVTNRFW